MLACSPEALKYPASVWGHPRTLSSQGRWAALTSQAPRSRAAAFKWHVFPHSNLPWVGRATQGPCICVCIVRVCMCSCVLCKYKFAWTCVQMFFMLCCDTCTCAIVCACLCAHVFICMVTHVPVQCIGHIHPSVCTCMFIYAHKYIASTCVFTWVAVVCACVFMHCVFHV